MITTLSWLPEAAWKGALLLAVAWVGARLLQRQPAALRHLLWTVALGGVIAMPLLSMATPVRVPIPIRQVVSASPTNASLDRNLTAPSLTEREAATRAGSAPAPIQTGPASRDIVTLPTFTADRIATVAIALWAVGLVAMAIRLLAGFIALRSIERTTASETDSDLSAALERAAARVGLRAVPRLVVSDRVSMPCATGWFKPVVLLPEAVRLWDADRRNIVLLHELTHIKRGDFVAHLISEVARAVYWFNPLVWLASRQVRAEAERATDERVVHVGAPPSEYAAHLLDIVRASSPMRVPAPLMPLARRTEFEGRLLAILESAGRHAVPTLRAVALTVLLVGSLTGAVASIGAARPVVDSSMPYEDDAVGTDPRTDPRTDPGTVTDPYVNPSAEPKVESPQAGPQAMDDRSTVAALAGVLGDPVPAVRRAAAEALGSSRDSVAVRALMSVLLQDDVAQVRRAAAYSLGRIEDQLAVPALMEALLKDADSEVRKNAAWALGAIDSPRAAPALAQALEDDRELSVRIESAQALGEIRDVSSMNALVRVLGQDDEPALLKSVIDALHNIDNASAATAVAGALRDRNADVRVAAAEALGSFEDRAVVPALMAAARDADAEVRRAVIGALQNLGDRRAIPAFTAALTDTDPEVRRSGADGLADMDNLRTAPPELIRAMDDRDAEVRQGVAHALGHILDPAGLNALVAHVGDANVEVRRSVVEALQGFEEEEATAALRTALRDQDAEVRESAARALGERSRK